MKTHLDLFTGIGGFALAARWAGFTTVGFCEKDHYAQKTLVKNWGAVMADHDGGKRRHTPTAPSVGHQEERSRQAGGCRQPVIHPDIRHLDGTAYLGVTLVTGGFPCQPFSCAGKRRGARDDRALWPEMLRVIAEARPAWVLAENVPGIIGMELDNVLSDLESQGYATWPLVLPACAVDAPHRRDRVWVVAHAKGVGTLATEQCGQQTGCAKPARAETENRGEDVEHPDKAGRGIPAPLHEGRRELSEKERDHSAFAGASGWHPKSGMGRVADGIPSGLDGVACWPEEDSHIPRISTGIPNYVQRLTCLGNAIVPQVAYRILRAIPDL